eukprot:6477385-Amphidinium_carterae.1
MPSPGKALRQRIRAPSHLTAQKELTSSYAKPNSSTLERQRTTHGTPEKSLVQERSTWIAKPQSPKNEI